MHGARMGLLVVLASVAWPASLHAMSSIDCRVLSSGGGVATSASFVTVGVIGEPVAGSATASVNYALRAGFISCIASAGVVDVPRSGLPIVTGISSVSPNPFRSVTFISFDVAFSSPISIRVFDTSGRLVRSLRNGVFPPGRYTLEWDGTAEDGTPLGSGVYYCQFRAGAVVETSRLIFIK